MFLKTLENEMFPEGPDIIYDERNNTNTRD